MMDDLSSGEGWPAPAKLNLMLHITGRRADGYHLLQTVFQLLDYGDTLRFKVTEGGRIRRCSVLPEVAETDDLTIRAASLLQRHGGIHHGVDIYLTKRLPLGGGLGGGSSDAATTLVALNQLWGCGLSISELASLGLRLGADVPVFIHGHSAWAEGIGERLQAIELPQRWYLVLKPAIEVSTASVFSTTELTRNCLPITISDFFSGRGTNVFEPVVRARYPAVAQALDWLSRHCAGHSDGVKLTGTGSCIFASFRSRSVAESLLTELSDEWQGFVAPGMNISPLLRRLRAEKSIHGNQLN